MRTRKRAFAVLQEIEVNTLTKRPKKGKDSIMGQKSFESTRNLVCLLTKEPTVFTTLEDNKICTNDDKTLELDTSLKRLSLNPNDSYDVSLSFQIIGFKWI